MSNPNCQQQVVIGHFLQVSRKHFGLDRRSNGFQARLSRVRRTVLNSLLIAGGLGGQFGGTAYADNSRGEASEARREAASPGSVLSDDY